MVYATRGLVDSLLRQARDREPDSITIPLATTAAADCFGGELPDTVEADVTGDVLGDGDLTPSTPVFTHFYMPNAGGSVNAVFGVDLGTPAGQTQGRFVSHPQGRLRLETTDDFHALVFVAVPPWDDDSIAVFDRHGTEQPLVLLDVEPPEDTPALG